MTLPDKVVEALARKGKFWDLTPAEVLKQNVILSAHGSDVPLALGPIIADLMREEADATEKARRTQGGGGADGQREFFGEGAGGQASPGGVNSTH